MNAKDLKLALEAIPDDAELVFATWHGIHPINSDDEIILYWPQNNQLVIDDLEAFHGEEFKFQTINILMDKKK